MAISPSVSETGFIRLNNPFSLSQILQVFEHGQVLVLIELCNYYRSIAYIAYMQQDCPAYKERMSIAPLVHVGNQ